MSKPIAEDIFSFSGRRNRQSYIVASLAIMLVIIVMWGIAFVMSGNGSAAPLIIAGLASIPAVIATWALGSQRCRDFGWTGWAILLTLIPYVGWIFAFAIMFVPGTPGANRYGPDLLSGYN